MPPGEGEVREVRSVEFDSGAGTFVVNEYTEILVGVWLLLAMEFES